MNKSSQCKETVGDWIWMFFLCFGGPILGVLFFFLMQVLVVSKL